MIIAVDAHDLFYSRLIEKDFVKVYTKVRDAKKLVTKIVVERHPEYVYVLTTSVGEVRIKAGAGNSELLVSIDQLAMFKHYFQLQQGFNTLYRTIGYIDGNDSSIDKYGEWVWETKSMGIFGSVIPEVDSVANKHLGYTNEWYKFERYK